MTNRMHNAEETFDMVIERMKNAVDPVKVERRREEKLQRLKERSVGSDAAKSIDRISSQIRRYRPR